MPVQLVGLTEGFKIIVDKPILLLGRDPECDIQFDSRKISRRHCCVAQVGDQLLVRDLGSTNGIRINGIRVVEGYLKEGDELTVGNHRYIVRWDSLPSAPRVGSRRVTWPRERRFRLLRRTRPLTMRFWRHPKSRFRSTTANRPEDL